MVYGERLDTFDDSKTDLQEFQNAAIQLIGSLASIANRPPLYKVFPTPTYRHFAQALTDVHKYGMFFYFVRYLSIERYQVLFVYVLNVKAFKYSCYLIFNVVLPISYD